MKGEFPRIHLPTPESREVLRQLRYRQRLVKLRTAVVNSLHAISLSAGLSLKTKLLTKAGRKRLLGLSLSLTHQQQRNEWLELIDQLNERIEPSGNSSGRDGEATRPQNTSDEVYLMPGVTETDGGSNNRVSALTEGSSGREQEMGRQNRLVRVDSSDRSANLPECRRPDLAVVVYKSNDVLRIMLRAIETA